MIKKLFTGFVLVIMAMVVSTKVAPAAELGTVIDSQYSTPEQPLSFELNVSDPVCTGSEVWEYWIFVQNNSDQSLVTAVADGRKGGEVEPGATAEILREAVSASDNVTLQYMFGDNPMEEHSFTVAAPICPAHPETPDVIEGVDCTLGNFTLPEVRNDNGNYTVGDVLSFELMIHGMPEGTTPYVSVTLDGQKGGFADLDPETLTFSFTPEHVGTYHLEGYFLDANGDYIGVVNPEMCSVTFTASADAIAQPVAKDPTVDPNTNPEIPAQVRKTPPAAASTATLPETGASSLALLSIAGLGLISVGKLLTRRYA